MSVFIYPLSPFLTHLPTLCVLDLFYSGSDGLLQFLLPNVQRQKY